MNNAVTSKDEIITISRCMMLEDGISSFSMRAVALRCGVAVGSIYNYFPSKADLISATIASVWEEIFLPFRHMTEFASYVEAVSCMFDTIQNGEKKFPGFFSVHSLNFASEDMEKGRQMMERYFGVLKETLIEVLKSDSKVRTGLFQNHLTMEKFVDYTFMLLISTLLKGQGDCLALLEMIENSIY